MAWRFGFWSLTAVFPLPLLITFAGINPGSWAGQWAVLMGVLAYAWWLLAIVLSVRPQWLDRKVGLPSIYAMHGLLGLAALAAAYLHKENSSTGNDFAAALGDYGFYISLFVVCYSMFFMSGWFSDRSAVIAKLKTVIERSIKHGTAIWIHRLNLVVLAMIWMHVHLFPQLTGNLLFIVTFNVFTLGSLGLYAWKKFIAPNNFVRGTVTANTALNQRTRQISIALDPTTTQSPRRQVQPGDFYFLQFQAPNMPKEWHPFSVTNNKTDEITFTIRQIGDYTGQLETLPTTTPVRLEGPFGLFNPIATQTTGPIVLFAMGAGIAPLLSLAQGHLPTGRPITLLWAISKEDDAYYAQDLADLQSEFPTQFDYHIQVGRFTKSTLAQHLSQDHIANATFFIVGPNPAVLSAQRTLKSLGTSSGQVHHERMTF